MNLSFELFPPKLWNDETENKYRSLINKLITFKPKFISCTYGANGGTKEYTLKVLNLIKELGGIPLAHCTFANQEFGEVEKYIDSLSANEIKKILVLRGDLPNGKEKFKFASEFMEYIKNNRTDFEIFGAWYPENHSENKQENFEAEIFKNFENKTKAGCTNFISQCFFDNDNFIQRSLEIKELYDVNLYAGIFPLLKYNQLQNVIKISGCKVPTPIVNFFEEHKLEPEAIFEYGINNTIEQIKYLVSKNITNIHIFTMVDEKSMTLICEAIKNV